MSQRNPTDLELTAYATAKITNSGNITDAFKAAFPKSKMVGAILHTAASKFDKLPKVCQRFERLQKEANEASDEDAIYTVQKAMEEYEQARQMAKAANNPAGMIRATDGKVKVSGLDKTNVNVRGGLAIPGFNDVAKAIAERSLDDFYDEELCNQDAQKRVQSQS